MADRLEVCREMGAMLAIKLGGGPPETASMGASEAAVMWAAEAGRMDACAAVYSALGKETLAAAYRANASLYAAKASDLWGQDAHG